MLEDNKIIAEFLDWEFDDLSETFETPFLKLVDPHAFGDEQFSCKLQDFELEFHSDWNWLMQVVEKIRVLVMEDVTDDLYNSGYWDNITHKLGEFEIESVYNACVEFIKWYNKQ